MLDTIAMWGGIAGCALALIAIVAISLIKGEIKQLLNKDNILFDKNFELKKSAIENALNLVDLIELNNDVIQLSDFQDKAKKCYNELLCVCSDMKLVEAFYFITTNKTNPIIIAQFKVNCRKDIGLSTKNSQITQRAAIQQKMSAQPQFERHIAPQSIPMQQPVQPMQAPQTFDQPIYQPVQQPVQMQQPVQQVPAQQTPVQQTAPMQQQAPVQRPVTAQPGVRPQSPQMQQRPVTRPMQQRPVAPTQAVRKPEQK